MYNSWYTTIGIIENMSAKREKKILPLFRAAGTSSGMIVQPLLLAGTSSEIVVRPDLQEKSSNLDLNIWNGRPTWSTGEVIRSCLLEWSSDLVYWRCRHSVCWIWLGLLRKSFDLVYWRGRPTWSIGEVVTWSAGAIVQPGHLEENGCLIDLLY